MAFTAGAGGELFLLGRIVFAAVLGYLALGNLLDLEGTVAYAGSKGAPIPSLSVPLASLALVAGSVSVLVGAYPLLGALAIAGFLLGNSPIMHDFWNAEGMDRQNEQFHFLKNVALAGTALVFAGLASVEWPYALGIGL